MCSAYGIDISVAFTKRLGDGFWGGEGFILQRLQGDGLTLVHAGRCDSGNETERGGNRCELTRVDTGCLLAIQESVYYDIQFVGGIKTAFLGGEGLFFAKLTGPGTVYLQTLPFSTLADRVASATRSSTGEVKKGGSVSGILGDIIGGDR